MSTSVRTTRALVAPLGLALAATPALAGSGLPAAADPTSAPRFDQSSGRGPDSVTRVEEPTKAEVVQRAAETAVAGDPIEMPTSYPYQPALRLYRDNPDDAAHTAELIGHPEIAPKLMELMAKSDRVSTQVVGQSTEGRDLYLVTVTAPEREQDTAQQTAWREAIKNDPAAAAEDAARAVPGISNSEGAGASWGSTTISLVTSAGFAAGYAVSSHSVSASVIAGEGAAMERDYDYATARFAAWPSADCTSSDRSVMPISMMRRMPLGKTGLAAAARLASWVSHKPTLASDLR